jgi:hypothetical protein
VSVRRTRRIGTDGRTRDVTVALLTKETLNELPFYYSLHVISTIQGDEKLKSPSRSGFRRGVGVSGVVGGGETLHPGAPLFLVAHQFHLGLVLLLH